MLYRYHTNILIVGVLTIVLMAIANINKTFNVMVLTTAFSFVTQLALLIYYARADEESLTEKKLFWLTFFYTVVMVVIYMNISYYYDGDTFMFSKADAMFYHRNSIIARDVGLAENLGRIMRTIDFEDWGALFFDNILLYLWPNKLIVNCAYVITGAVSSVLLYRIGEHFMPRRYAFMASLSYSTSSYLIFFHCTFIKESLFVFLVIVAVYNIYRFIFEENVWFLVVGFFFTALLVFFRPAVAALIIVGFFIYYAIDQRGNAISLFLFGASAIGIVVSLGFIQSSVDKYTAGGNMEGVVDYRSNSNYSSSFNYFVSFFGALFGPFPTVFPNPGGLPVRINFYAAGLIEKLFLVVPFWIGVYFLLLKGNIKMLPMTIFILLEMLMAGYICASLELRKVLLHVPFMYVVSFYALARMRNTHGLRRLVELPSYLMAVGILLFWNVIRV